MITDLRSDLSDRTRATALIAYKYLVSHDTVPYASGQIFTKGRVWAWNFIWN